MDENPKVSICATFFNAGKYIDRLLQSCLRQTYQNIELVIVDDASTDNSKEIIEEYAKNDSRIKYVRNEKNIGLAESELQMFELATGKYSVMLGADDWLAKDFIEKGVGCFEENPSIAGIIPRLISLREKNNSTFDLVDDTFSEFSEVKIRSSEWFVKNLYKPKELYVSALALVRSDDYKRAMHFYVENYYRNLPENAPEKTKHLMKMAFGMDGVVFLEMLTRYEHFAFYSAMRYMKIALHGGQANNLNFQRASLNNLIEESYHQLKVFSPVYNKKWPKFIGRMKTFKGAEVIGTAVISIFVNKLRPSFINIKESQKIISAFFKEYSAHETLLVVVTTLPLLLARSSKFLYRKISGKSKIKKSVLSEIYVFGNFLNKEKYFTVD